MLENTEMYSEMYTSRNYLMHLFMVFINAEYFNRKLPYWLYASSTFPLGLTKGVRGHGFAEYPVFPRRRA